MIPGAATPIHAHGRRNSLGVYLALGGVTTSFRCVDFGLYGLDWASARRCGHAETNGDAARHPSSIWGRPTHYQSRLETVLSLDLCAPRVIGRESNPSAEFRPHETAFQSLGFRAVRERFRTSSYRWLDGAATTFSSIAIGVGRQLTSRVVRVGWLDLKYSA